METGKVSMRYAKALLQYALEKKQEDSLYKEMKALIANFTAEPDLLRVIDNPTVSGADKRKLLTTAAGINTCDVFQSFLQLLSKNRREIYVLSIALQYQRMYRDHKGMVLGKLISAQKIPSEMIDKLKKIISKKGDTEVDFSTTIDSSLIGGFILDIESTRLDASISNQLRLVKKELVDENKQLI